MIKTLKFFLAGLVAVSGGMFSLGSSAALAQNGTYILLSPYYALPGQNVTVQGYRFGGNEQVSVNLDGMSQVLTTSGDGSFSSQPFTIPFNAIASQLPVTALGAQGENVSANLTVGTFYGLAIPSSWYLVPGGQISFTGSRFAPGEKINVQQGGQALTQVTADGSGNFSTGVFSVPYSSGTLNYIFTGQSSGVTTGVNVSVGNEPPYILLDNYYVDSGATLHITGHAFGNAEKVNLSLNRKSIGSAMTDNKGVFSTTISIPTMATGSLESIGAQGMQTGKMGQASFILAGQ